NAWPASRAPSRALLLTICWTWISRPTSHTPIISGATNIRVTRAISTAARCVRAAQNHGEPSTGAGRPGPGCECRGTARGGREGITSPENFRTRGRAGANGPAGFPESVPGLGLGRDRVLSFPKRTPAAVARLPLAQPRLHLMTRPDTVQDVLALVRRSRLVD